MARLLDLTGKTFGKWRVIRRAPNDRSGLVQWICRCACGEEKPVRSRQLIIRKSLGCRTCSSRSKLRPYEALYNSLSRVAEVKCLSLMSFEDFLEFTKTLKCFYCNDDVVWRMHNVHKYPRYNLDRKNNLKGYEKHNVVVCCKQCNLLRGDHLSFGEMCLLKSGLQEIQELRKCTTMFEIPSSLR